MERKDFVLVWMLRKEQKYLCRVCSILAADISVAGLNCPIDTSIIKCGYEKEIFFDNTIDIIIITQKDCFARQHKCRTACGVCVANKLFHIDVH